MAGYSGTPLPKKLGIKEKLRVTFVGLPTDVKADLRDALAGCTVVKNGRAALDFAMVFAKTQGELKGEFVRLTKLLAPSRMLWVCWPKKTSGVATDMNENDVRRIGLEAGLVDVKVCAVSQVWSGLKFVRRVKDRQSFNRKGR
ncbi:MAG TPA: DUF3052 family protein [Terriglobales bacterium]|nr:DUF3052 family protein [Terriglobales bacterium]